jgi:hypothetical protein
LFSEMEVQKRQHSHERQPILSAPGAPERGSTSAQPKPSKPEV